MHAPPAGSRHSTMELTDGLLWRLSQESEGARINDELDNLEQKLSTALSVIRSLRNMSSPVHRLPSDILLTIFKKLQELSTPASYLPRLGDYPYAYPLESVTRVCRRWREIALSVSSLWSLVFNGEEHLITTFIKRSGLAPLKVYLQGACQNGWGGFNHTDPLSTRDLTVVEALKDHSNRIQELHLIDIGSPVANIELLQRRAPLLECLTISVGFPAFPPTNAPHPGVISDLFDGFSPNLRRMTLHGFTSWSGNLFQNLTHLTLSHQDTAHPVTLSQFMTFLAACPLLEELALVRPVILFDGNALPSVPLSRLRSLSLGSWGSSQHVSDFLSCVVLPPNIEMFIWGTRHQVDDTLAEICPFPPTLLANVSDFRVTHNPDRQLGSLDLGWGNEDNLYNVFLTRTTFQIDGSFLPSRVLLLAPQIFPLGGVTELWIGSQSHPEPDNQTWQTFFTSVPLLKTLVISRRSSQPIISALTLEGNDVTALLCPELCTLRLYADTSRSVLRLAILAEERMRHGSPIETLQVISSVSRHSSRRTRSPELVSDFMYLQKFIKNVDCTQRDTNTNWELLPAWPPDVFNWIPGERR